MLIDCDCAYDLHWSVHVAEGMTHGAELLYVTVLADDCFAVLLLAYIRIALQTSGRPGSWSNGGPGDGDILEGFVWESLVEGYVNLAHGGMVQKLMVAEIFY